MKKISYEYILYYLQITFIGIFILVLSAYNIEIEQKGFLERSMYSENVKGIQLSSEYLVSVKGEVVEFAIPEKVHGDYMIYKHLSEEYNEIIRGAYGTADIFKYSQYISEGHFFTEDDYNKQTAVAVIGYSMKDKVYSENGKTYFGYNNQLYEVIGIFKETGTDLDYSVYLNLTNLINNMDNYGLYYVDAKEESVVNEVISSMHNDAQDKYSVSDVKYESRGSYGLNGMNNTLLICAVLAAFLNLIVSSIFFVTKKKYTVAIQKLCGMTSKELCMAYGKRMVVLAAAGFVSIYIVIRLFSGYLGFFFSLDKLSWQHYLVTAALLVFVVFIVTGFIIRQAQRVNISDSLKGR